MVEWIKNWQKKRMKGEIYYTFSTHFFFDCRCISPSTLNPDGTRRKSNLTTPCPVGFSATRLLDLAITERMVDIHLSCIIRGAAKGASPALETMSGVSVRNDDLICVSLSVHSMLIHIYLF